MHNFFRQTFSRLPMKRFHISSLHRDLKFGLGWFALHFNVFFRFLLIFTNTQSQKDEKAAKEIGVYSQEISTLTVSAGEHFVRSCMLSCAFHNFLSQNFDTHLYIPCYVSTQCASLEDFILLMCYVDFNDIFTISCSTVPS